MGEKMTLILLLVISSWTSAQNPMGDIPTDAINSVSCSGSVAGAVIITIVVIFLSALGTYFCCSIRGQNKAKNKVDPEYGTTGGYDNPQFVGDDGCENDKAKNASPSIKTTCETSPSAVISTATNTSGTLDRGKTAFEKVFSAVVGGVKLGVSPKVKDDSCLEPRQKLVPLQGRDFSGLGFTIVGNLKEGIFVKDVQLRGPAVESGKIVAGDKIMALTVLMDHMVYEDAQTIFSFASPYPVILHLESGKALPSPFFKGKLSPSNSKLKGASKNSSDNLQGRIAHPKLSRSQSLDKLTHVGIQINNVTTDKEVSPRFIKIVPSPSAPKRAMKDIESYVTREGINRYSERAIDVPGSKELVKESEPEKDSSELTSVQVHRSTQDVDEVESSSTITLGSASNREQQNSDKQPKPEATKPKFGIKVLPEIISFKEKNLKDNNVKMSYATPLSNKSKLNIGEGKADTNVSSISLLSSMKGDAEMKVHKMSSSSEGGQRDHIEKHNIPDPMVSSEKIVMRDNSKLRMRAIEKDEINIKVESATNESVPLNSPPNLTFFSHANFPQSSNNKLANFQPAAKMTDNIDGMGNNSAEIVVEADLNSRDNNIQSIPPDWSNEEAPSGESTPDISHELDEATLSEVNATDATKKRKYRYMLASSSIALPENHQTEDVQLVEIGTQDLWENQSDEAKSLSLKVKPQSVNLETGHNGNLDIDDSSFYSTNMSSTSMALHLDDIEVEPDDNVSDEKKMKVIGNIVLPPSIEGGYSPTIISAVNGKTSNSLIKENANDYRPRNNSHKISFTEFALSDTIPIDMTTLSFKPNEENPSNSSTEAFQLNNEEFGSVFGFQGFKNRVNSTDESEPCENIIDNTLTSCEASADLNDTDNRTTIVSSPNTLSISTDLNSSISYDEKGISNSEDALLSNAEDSIVHSGEINKEIANEVSTINNDENKKSKSKMNFGFRRLSRSSSDTDEDKEKVSTDPAGKSVKKSKIKTSLPFRFRSRSRSSDSEDSGDHKKIETDPSGVDFSRKTDVHKSDEHKLKHIKQHKEVSNNTNKTEETVKTQKPPRSTGKKFPDAEEELNEGKINYDPKAVQEKSKDTKSKSLKLGFKGFKNLKGKIQTEINKIRQETPLSDEDSELKEAAQAKSLTQTFEDEIVIQDIDTVMMEHAAIAAKENRRKVSRNSSSSSISPEEGENMSEQRKKKKTKSKKRTDKSRIVTTGVMQVELHTTEINTEVHEEISAESRLFQVHMPTINDIAGNHTVPEIVTNNIGDVKNIRTKSDLNYEIEPKYSPRYVVKTEMLLTPSKSYPNSSIDEVFDKVIIERKIPRPMLIEERAIINIGTDTDGGSYGSDSDMENAVKIEKSHCETSVNLSAPSKRSLTDSEELKRKTASLGDLSKINEGLNVGSILERAVSLDLNATTDNHGSLHVKRLKLPDSSATSIDEVDEKVPYSPMKLEQPIIGLKAASQWGTLEEALQLANENSNSQYHSNQSGNNMNGLTEYIRSDDITDKSVSNIEISGGCGPSITSLSSNEDLWNSVSYDPHPLSDLIPLSKGKTTITLQNDGSHDEDNHYTPDSSIVIIPDISNDRSELSNLKVKVPSLSSSTPDVLLISNVLNSDDSYPEYNHDVHVGDYSPTMNEVGSNIVTLTMVSAEDPNSNTPLNFTPPPVPPKPRPNQPSISPDLQSFDSGISAPLVTVSNDWSQCDPDVNVESSDLNSSDDFISPGISPQKSMTQISVDGVSVSGYTVQDGDFSKTVIISNPDLIS